MIAKIWKKRSERLKNWLSEVQTFRIVLERAKNKSELSWKYVYEPRTWCFAHILAKGMYPSLRNDPNNIIFVADIKEHELVDHFVAHNKMVFLDLVKKWTALERLKNDFFIHKIQKFLHPCFFDFYMVQLGKT